MTDPHKKRKTLLYGLWWLRAEFVALSVLRVFRYNEKNEAISGFGPRDSSWVLHSAQRYDLRRRARREWGVLTGKDFTWFPYSADAVARMYVRFIGATDEQVAAWERELNEAVES